VILDRLTLDRLKAMRTMPGDRVRITKGPLAGRSGMFKRLSARRCVCVLLDMLGTSQTVTLSEAELEPEPTAEAA
jgi:transcription antitermination factor NusG